MALIIPQTRQITWESSLDATPSSTSPGATVTADATIHTKGAYAQLIASTTYDSYGFYLLLAGSTAAATDTSMLFDLALGAAASEVVILPNLMCGSRATPLAGAPLWFIPLFIPKGSRVSGRLQSLISADTIDATVFLNGGSSRLPTPIFTGCDAYGIDTADSGGTAHTPGNAGAESTDANVGDVLSRNYGGVMLDVGLTGTILSSQANHYELTDGTNTLCEWYASISNTETIFGPFPNSPHHVNLASGTQLQIQAESSLNPAEAHDVAFYCFY